MSQIIQDWWGAFLAVGGAILAWRIGAEKNSWRIAALDEDLREFKSRISSLEAHRLTDVERLAQIQTTLQQMVVVLSEIQSDLKTKADK